jgi:hypothetical protein
MTDTDPSLQSMQDLRGVYDPCDSCQGTGVRSYSSTSTWRGGIGGQAFTNGPCDSCWGSGCKYRPWTDLRKLEQGMEAEVQRRAEEWFERKLGSKRFGEEEFGQLIEVLEKESRKRVNASGEYKELCTLLVLVLRGRCD